jgi:hypothetical protein
MPRPISRSFRLPGPDAPPTPVAGAPEGRTVLVGGGDDVLVADGEADGLADAEGLADADALADADGDGLGDADALADADELADGDELDPEGGVVLVANVPSVLAVTKRSP